MYLPGLLVSAGGGLRRRERLGDRSVPQRRRVLHGSGGLRCADPACRPAGWWGRPARSGIRPSCLPGRRWTGWPRPAAAARWSTSSSRMRAAGGVPSRPVRQKAGLALHRGDRPRLRLGDQQSLRVGRHQRAGDRQRAAGPSDTVAISSFFRLPAERGRLAGRRRPIHPRRDRAALGLALALPLAPDDLDGGGTAERRDGISDDDADAALGGHAVAGRRPDA